MMLVLKVYFDWFFEIVLPCLPFALVISVPLMRIFNTKIVRSSLKHKRA